MIGWWILTGYWLKTQQRKTFWLTPTRLESSSSLVTIHNLGTHLDVILIIIAVNLITTIIIRTDHSSSSEDPQEHAVHHHRHDPPVLILLGIISVSMITIIITIIMKIIKIFIVFNVINVTNIIISIIVIVFMIIIVTRRPAGNLWVFLKLVLKFEFVIVFGSEFWQLGKSENFANIGRQAVLF